MSSKGVLNLDLQRVVLFYNPVLNYQHLTKDLKLLPNDNSWIKRIMMFVKVSSCSQVRFHLCTDGCQLYYDYCTAYYWHDNPHIALFKHEKHYASIACMLRHDQFWMQQSPPDIRFCHHCNSLLSFMSYAV